MKAMVLEGPGKAAIKTVPEVRTKRADEIVLEVRMVGLCGSDLNSYRGRNPMVSYPRIPGHEVAAVVAEVNPLHPEWQVGMTVTLSPYTSCGQCVACQRGKRNTCRFNQTMGIQRDGALTQYVAVPAGNLYRADLTLRELCLVEPLTVGFHAAARGRVEPGDVVAVLGCGGVGLGAVAGAAFRGGEVIGVDVDDRKLTIARKAGATHTINSQHGDLHEQLAALTKGQGPDVIIEAIGLPETFRAAVEEVAFSGRVVYIGYTKELVTYETRLFVQKELDIVGARNAMPEDFRAVIRMLEEHRFPVRDAITEVVPMRQAPGSLEAWSQAPANVSKIMVEIH
jgi:threonine dehydrogenase-like Zn-dependent dehydrogenase